LPFVILIGATRGMLGVGLGLLLSERIRRKDRRQLAGILVAVGAISSIPLGITLLRKARQGRSMTGEPTLANVPQSGADEMSEGLMAD
jgi:hypothetical protein